jgi:hypothetical protein
MSEFAILVVKFSPFWIARYVNLPVPNLIMPVNMGRQWNRAEH